MAMKDLDRKTYQNLVRFNLYSTTMWADVDIEWNITSSDVEFLEGRNTIGNDEGSREKNLPDIGEASFVLDKEWADYDLECPAMLSSWKGEWSLTTMKDLEKKTYQISVRLHLCLTRMWADDDNLEQNSDVSLEERDFIKKGNAMTWKKKKENPVNTRGACVSSDNTKLLTTTDLSGMEDDDDIYIKDIMSVNDQIINKKLTLSQPSGPCK